ncbi:MAG: hypothetical protein DMG02_25040 [Acidobacteria bacterium]|nr:MAG: hypothetical protein DMG02_25040 [Acidobacteriota bacterium]
MRSPIASVLLREGCNYIVLNVSQLSAADSLVLGAIVLARDRRTNPCTQIDVARATNSARL